MATSEKTGKAKPFFIEYYVVNPGRWKGEIVLGQKKEPGLKQQRPCYALIKAGAWGEEKAQLHGFYGIDEFHASRNELDCSIGENTLTETSLRGGVVVTRDESENFPERMSDPGSMNWNLTVEKEVKFDMGYGSSGLMNFLGAFHMYWHAQGMKSKYQGEVIFNNERFKVEPETSFGYQDKNWGRDYTNPWIWLNCNNFRSRLSNSKVDASFDLGGGCPIVFGISLPRRILTAFYYRGQFTEFNFSKFWLRSSQRFSTREDAEYFYWDVVSENRRYRIEANFKCEKSKMLLINYENPEGEKNHDKLWNGGHAEGILKFYRKESKGFILVDELEGALGGCEYGEY